MKALVITLMLAGCGMMPKPNSAESLTDTVTAYNDSMRWGRYEMAAAHLPPKQRSQFVDESDVHRASGAPGSAEHAGAFFTGQMLVTPIRQCANDNVEFATDCG